MLKIPLDPYFSSLHISQHWPPEMSTRRCIFPSFCFIRRDVNTHCEYFHMKLNLKQNRKGSKRKKWSITELVYIHLSIHSIILRVRTVSDSSAPFHWKLRPYDILALNFVRDELTAELDVCVRKKSQWDWIWRNFVNKWFDRKLTRDVRSKRKTEAIKPFERDEKANESKHFQTVWPENK
jgi:hypothetical protein